MVFSFSKFSDHASRLVEFLDVTWNDKKSMAVILYNNGIFAGNNADISE